MKLLKWTGTQTRVFSDTWDIAVYYSRFTVCPLWLAYVRRFAVHYWVVGSLFAGVSPALWVLDAGCVWLVKLRMLLFALLSSIFALFIALIGRPIRFNFLFFNKFRVSSILYNAPKRRLLPVCKSLEDSVKNYEIVAIGKSIESVSFIILARYSSLILIG
jgi:hypothetical protein